MGNSYSIMLNIKSIFITTGLSVLFGIYSIYNIIEYLRVLHKNHFTEINNLNIMFHKFNKRHIDLSEKCFNLELKYNCLVSKYEELNLINKDLKLKYDDLKQNLIYFKETIVDVQQSNDVQQAHDDIQSQLIDDIFNRTEGNLTTSISNDLESSLNKEQLNVINNELEYKIKYNYDYDYNDLYLEQELKQKEYKKPYNKKIYDYSDVHVNKIIQENIVDSEFIDSLHFDYDGVKQDYDYVYDYGYDTEYNNLKDYAKVKQEDLISYPYERKNSINSSVSSLSNLSQKSMYSDKSIKKNKSSSVINDLWIGLTQKFL